MEYVGSKTAEYVGVICTHVVRPMEATALMDSCFAAAILVFSAIDGLGKLTHPSADARPGERFKSFLPRLGRRYAELADELWGLRNSLVHNALNVACFMSKIDEARGEHLEQHQGKLFMHTKQLLDDFKVALESLECDLRCDTSLLQRAESRLFLGTLEVPGWRSEIETTKPPAIRIGFVQQTP